MRSLGSAVAVVAASAAVVVAGCGSSDTETAATGASGESTGGEQVELTFASYIGEAAPQSQALEWWADQVEQRSDGRITVKSYYQESLLKAADLLGGVADGRADIGYISNAYYPAELPLASVVEVPFTTSNAEAQARALKDLYDANEEFQEEWDAQNVRPLLFPAIGSNIVGARDAVEALGDLDGKSIRGLGLINEALQKVGANPVAIAAPEIYESLQRGVIDGYSGFAFEVIPALKLQEVAPHVTDTGLGEYTSAIIIMNDDTYQSLPDDLRAVVDEVSDEAVERSLELLKEAEDATCDAITEAGGAVTRLSDADIEAWKDAVGESLVDEWISQNGSREFYDAYVDLVRGYESDSDYVAGAERCAERDAP